MVRTTSSSWMGRVPNMLVAEEGQARTCIGQYSSAVKPSVAAHAMTPRSLLLHLTSQESVQTRRAGAAAAAPGSARAAGGTVILQYYHFMEGGVGLAGAATGVADEAGELGVAVVREAAVGLVAAVEVGRGRGEEGVRRAAARPDRTSASADRPNPSTDRPNTPADRPNTSADQPTNQPTKVCELSMSRRAAPARPLAARRLDVVALLACPDGRRDDRALEQRGGGPRAGLLARGARRRRDVLVARRGVCWVATLVRRLALAVVVLLVICPGREPRD